MSKNNRHEYFVIREVGGVKANAGGAARFLPAQRGGSPPDRTGRACSIRDWSKLSRGDYTLVVDMDHELIRRDRWRQSLSCGCPFPGLVVLRSLAHQLVQHVGDDVLTIHDVALDFDGDSRSNGVLEASVPAGGYSVLVPRPIADLRPVGGEYQLKLPGVASMKPLDFDGRDDDLPALIGSTNLNPVFVLGTAEVLELLRQIGLTELNVCPLSVGIGGMSKLGWTLGQRKWPPKSYYGK